MRCRRVRRSPLRAATACQAGPTPSRVSCGPRRSRTSRSSIASTVRAVMVSKEGRRRPRARESRLPRHRRRRDDPARDVERCSGDGNAGVRAHGGRNADCRSDRRARARDSRPLEPAGRARGATPPAYRAMRPANRFAVHRSMGRSAPRATVRKARADRRAARSSTDRTSGS